MADKKDDNPQNIIMPGDVPPWPYESSNGDVSVLAKAAWAQSFGDITAFHQLARDHENGALDLLATKDMSTMVLDVVPQPRMMSAPSSALPQGMVGTNDYIAADRVASEHDRVQPGQNIQGDAPVARVNAERDEARASSVRAAGEAAIQATTDAVGTAARQERVSTAERRAEPRTSALAPSAPSAPSAPMTPTVTTTEGRVIDGERSG